MRIGLYVGSFDPVHIGHKHIVDYLLNNNYLDKVIIVPTGVYWEKQNITDINHRINMLKYHETDKIIIDDKHNNLPYTYEVLNGLKKDYPGSTLHLLIGADNLVKFHLWKNIDEILQNKVLVLPRNNIEITKYINNFKQKDNFIIIQDFKEIEVSSSIIRDKIKNQEYKDLNKYLDKNILNYIIKNNLYKNLIK